MERNSSLQNFDSFLFIIIIIDQESGFTVTLSVKISIEVSLLCVCACVHACNLRVTCVLQISFHCVLSFESNDEKHSSSISLTDVAIMKCSGSSEMKSNLLLRMINNNRILFCETIHYSAAVLGGISRARIGLLFFVNLGFLRQKQLMSTWWVESLAPKTKEPITSHHTSRWIISWFFSSTSAVLFHPVMMFNTQQNLMRSARNPTEKVFWIKHRTIKPYVCCVWSAL